MEVSSRHLTGRTKKYQENLSRGSWGPTLVPTEDLPITSLERYRYDNPLGKSHSSVTVNRYAWHSGGEALCYKPEGRGFDNR
jgi:hypothetical protein